MTVPKRSYRGATPEQRLAKRRAQLLDAGIRVFGDIGYRRATVRSICTAAGLSDRYFYEQFEDSEALLAACFEVVTAGVIGEAQAGPTGREKGPMEFGRAILRAYFAALQREQARARVFLVEMVGISPAIDRLFDSTLDDLAARIGFVMDPAGRGPLRRDPLLGRGIASGLIGIATAWVRSGYAASLDEVAEAALTLCTIAAPPREPR